MSHEVVTVHLYRSGGYTPEPTVRAMTKLFDLLKLAGARTSGSTTHFTSELDGHTLVFEVQDKRCVS